MPKKGQTSNEAEPKKEISEENRRLAEEFEREVDSKLNELGESDTIDVIAVEHESWITSNEGTAMTLKMAVDEGVGQNDISTDLKGRILAIRITTKKADGGGQEMGKMLTIPDNLDLTGLKFTLTDDGHFQIEAPIGSAFVQGQNDHAPSSVALQLHNAYRKRHGVGPLTLNVELSKLAETYARAQIKGTAVNLDESNLGRNIFEFKLPSGEKPSSDAEIEAVRQAVATWYAANQDYNWEDPLASPVSAKTFYEIVFKTTAILGFGLATSGELVVIVALYCRPASCAATNEGHKQNVLPAVSTDVGD